MISCMDVCATGVCCVVRDVTLVSAVCEREKFRVKGEKIQGKRGAEQQCRARERGETREERERERAGQGKKSKIKKKKNQKGSVRQTGLYQ